MDLKTLSLAVQQIATEKGIPPEKVFSAIEVSLAAAYKKEYRKRSEVIRAKFNAKTGEMQFAQVKTVVLPEEVRMVDPDAPEELGDEREITQRGDPIVEGGEVLLPRYNADRHIFLEEAKSLKADVNNGDELEFPLESHADFGRIASQTAKQVILQGLRDAERASIREEFSGKEGEIVSGIVQRFEQGNLYVDIGRGVGVAFHNECIPGERYRVGERLRFYVVAVQDDPRRPGIILSRAHPRFVSKLFALEVPEIAEGTVEIKNIAREPGSRTKVAVYSGVEGVDPVGSAVGQRGTRVMAVTNELGNEKIDIVQWSEDPATYIAGALSPAKVKLVEIFPHREARALVQEDQLSLAIGKGGQNVRLAARLTGWSIDVRSQANPDTLQIDGIADFGEDEIKKETKEEDKTVKEVSETEEVKEAPKKKKKKDAES